MNFFDLPGSVQRLTRITVTVKEYLSRLVARHLLGGLLLALTCNAHAWLDNSTPGTTNPVSPVSAPATKTVAGSSSDAGVFYTDEVDFRVQQACILCHKAGGTASRSGARLVLTPSPADNHKAFVEMLDRGDVDGNWILAKVVGQHNHGGGAVSSQNSDLYQLLQQYLILLGKSAGEMHEQGSFWEGTASEPRETTYRRAALLFSGTTPSEEEVSLAARSEKALRRAVLKSLSGPGFKDFILRGANDRLLVEGLMNGINFDIATRDRYPELAKLMLTLPEDPPEEFEDYHEKPFLSRGEADWSLRWAITREPLELIAHVILNNKSYRQILTAQYTMVNGFSDLAYRANTGLRHEFADDRGFFDRSQYNRFVPGYNDGHIPHDNEFEFSEENGIASFSDYHEWPHAGILSTQAWLARYPSTDTNRNRARARWTYFHFLGVDIEKSAPRTTDPVALADTDNPTMKNNACAVCHERLDPVAGAYQSFGDLGHYLDQYGGEDSLADSYKCPECFGGERGSSGYEEGDTWYRDMRSPGYEGKHARGARDSLQWLGHRLSRDPRFAAATVRFWWPAIFGADPLVAPEDDQALDYEALLRAYNEQDALIVSLAERFEAAGFNARQLFVNMVMSRWYRHSEVTKPELMESRWTELATVGRGRLLGPEELDRKNLAVFGRTWRQWNTGFDAHNFSRETALTGSQASFKGFYGGIDSAAVTTRNRQITPLMSNLTESMASDLACQIVIEDFNRPRGQRLVFEHVDRTSVPGRLIEIERSLPGKISDMRRLKSHSLYGSITTVPGPSRVRIEDRTPEAYSSVDGEWTDAQLVVKEILFRKKNRLVKRVLGTHLPRNKGFHADQWHDDDGTQHWRGSVEDGVGWRMHSGAWVEFVTNLAPGVYEIEVRLGTALRSNNVNDAMLARLDVRATKNVKMTASAEHFRKQVQGLAVRALHHELSNTAVNQMISLVTETADEANRNGNGFLDTENRCDTWSIWPEEELSHEQHQVRNDDPEGMMRGWTALLHGIMTSYEYLHD